jgi:hypothetical protein
MWRRSSTKVRVFTFVFHVNAFADTSVQTIQDPLSFISTLVTMPARFSSKLNATRWC